MHTNTHSRQYPLPVIILTSLVFLPLKHRPPTSPLFPYTTLFRSADAEATMPMLTEYIRQAIPADRRSMIAAVGRDRSEEQTSELQSQSNLVCRLLLVIKNEGSYFLVAVLLGYQLVCLWVSSTTHK